MSATAPGCDPQCEFCAAEPGTMNEYDHESMCSCHVDTCESAEAQYAAAGQRAAAEVGPNDCTCWATSRNGCPVHYVR